MWSIMKDNAHFIGDKRNNYWDDLMCFLILLNVTRMQGGAQLGPAPLSPPVFDFFP